MRTLSWEELLHALLSQVLLLLLLILLRKFSEASMRQPSAAAHVNMV